MIDRRNGINGNPFDDHLEHEQIPQFIPSKNYNPFIRIPIVIACTILVFVLLIAGTATTAISFPPEPPQWKVERNVEDNTEDVYNVRTALDGDYKLVGPLLIMAGGFLLILNVILCAILTRDAYYSSRSIRPSSNTLSNSAPMSLLGGPFFLAIPSANERSSVTPYPFSRQMWAMPNAPLPDFVLDGGLSKGTEGRARTATLTRCHQPPFNPDVDAVNQVDK